MADVLKATGLERLQIVHGFSLRSGGVSEGPYRSLNLGRAVGDDPARVAENHRLFEAALGLVPGCVHEVSQVHGRRVRRVLGGEQPARVRVEEADALVAIGHDLTLGVRVADCLSVLLVDANSGAVAAVHAGWRGLVRGVLGEAVEAMLRLGGGSQRLHAAVFPHIRACCFEIGDDVAEQLQRAADGPGVVLPRPAGRPHADLLALATLQLVQLGVASEDLESVAGCTRCEPQRFFSYRRDGQRSGRHLAVIRAPT